MKEAFWLPALAPIAAAGTTWILLRIMASRSRIPLDHPNERSLHRSPVPRIGGLAVLPAIWVGWTAIPQAVHWSIWLASGVLFLLSFLDDALDLRVLLRLVTHLLAAAAVALAVVEPSAGAVAALVSWLAIAWMTNLYNFMDGSDGLAGGMSLIGFCSYAIAAWLKDDLLVASACVTIAAASLVFLRSNFHPAKVFLGDAGSIPLGFLAAALGIQGWVAGVWPAWFPFVVFSPFIVDATVTLVRRCIRRERIWHAHREHYYQRLVQLGWGHKRTALAEYALMVACAAGALAALNQAANAHWLVLIACLSLYVLLGALVDRAWRRRIQGQ